MERRDPAKKATSVTCIGCEERVALNSERMRLTITHAILCCPGCGVELAVRRADAFRGRRDGVEWDFAVYSEADASATTTPPPTMARGRHTTWAHVRQPRTRRGRQRHIELASRVPSMFLTGLPTHTRSR